MIFTEKSQAGFSCVNCKGQACHCHGVEKPRQTWARATCCPIHSDGRHRGRAAGRPWRPGSDLTDTDKARGRDFHAAALARGILRGPDKRMALVISRQGNGNILVLPEQQRHTEVLVLGVQLTRLLSVYDLVFG